MVVLLLRLPDALAFVSALCTRFLGRAGPRSEYKSNLYAFKTLSQFSWECNRGGLRTSPSFEPDPGHPGHPGRVEL